MKRVWVLYVIVIVLTTSMLLMLHSRMDEKNNSPDQVKEEMGRYEYDDRGLGIALIRVMTSKSVRHNFGRPFYPKEKAHQYIWVYIKLNNTGMAAVQAKPEEFTLSISGEAAVSYDFKTTTSMQKGMKTVNIKPGKQEVGLLIFVLPESREYTLHYNGPNGAVDKEFVVQSP